MRVLIVEDEVEAGSALKKLLEREGGVAAALAGTFTGAIEEAKNFHPDVIFLDCELPDSSPFATIEKSRELGPAVKVFTSAYKEEALVLAAFKAGGSDFIIKDKDSNVVERIVYAYFRKIYAAQA